MSITYDEPAAGQTEQPAPGVPGGPGGSDATKGKSDGWFRRHRLLTLAAVAIISVSAGGGIAYSASGGSAALTTAQIMSRTNPGVVDVVATDRYQHGTSSGTGIVLTSTGEVLTNNHVIEGATAVKVTDVGNGRTYTAAVVGYDAKDDIAVLQLRHASGLKTAVLGSSSTIKAGERVVAIGNAGGRGGRPAAVTGKVTALGQSITVSDQAASTTEHLSEMIRTSAPIKAGDSGGPLVNRLGQVIGIDTAVSSSGPQLASAHSTQSFAIPISKAASIADQIEAGKTSAAVHTGATAFIGVEAVSGSARDGSTGTGVTIAGVVSGSPAAKAGLHAGDQITSVAGHTVTSSAGIRNVLELYRPGDKISVSWSDQAGHTHTATVVLTTGPAG